MSDEEFARMFRQLDRASHVDALEVLAVWQARTVGPRSDVATRRVRACNVVLGVCERRVYR